MSHIMPALVHKLTYGHDAWVVGSAANPDADLSKVRDYDILVSMNNWREAALLISENATVNTFGGWKCQSEGKEVDVWPGDLAWLLTNAVVKYAWHPRTNTRIASI